MQQTQAMHERPPRRGRKSLRVVLITFAVFIGGAVMENVAGNIGSNILTSFGALIIVYLKADYWPWVISLLFLVTTVYLWWSNRLLNQAFTTSTNLNELDDSLLRLLGSWNAVEAHDIQMQHMLVELLRDASREFGEHVQRSMILLPDEGGEYLRVWAHSKMPDESVKRMRFYIGSDSNKQISEGIGVAGEAFLYREIRVAHMHLTSEGWVCDCRGYKSFARRVHEPVYRSFVCMPIYGPPSDTFETKVSCLGVVCFDSPNRTVFDTDDAEVILRAFTRRIATALLIYRLLAKDASL